MRRPGIEPGPPAWQARIVPLNHRRMLLIEKIVYLFISKIQDIHRGADKYLYCIVLIICSLNVLNVRSGNAAHTLNTTIEILFDLILCDKEIVALARYQRLNISSVNCTNKFKMTKYCQLIIT